MRHGTSLVAALLLAACGGDDSAARDAFFFPIGDPDGGSVAGLITTDLTSTAGTVMYIGAFAPDGGALLAAVTVDPPVFPVHYQLDRIPGGPQVIRALLDFPPYAPRPLVDPPGFEDATGVFLNAASILPVDVRPGTVTSRIDFFVTRMH